MSIYLYLPSAHPNWDRGPQKNFNCAHEKFGLKFSVCASITSRLVGASSQSFYHTTCGEPWVITLVGLQFLEGLPPKTWDGKKTSKIFRDFWQLSNLIANICETDPQIENRKSIVDQLQPLPRWTKNTVNFCPQPNKLLTCILAHPSGHFSWDYISALRGCYSL